MSTKGVFTAVSGAMAQSARMDTIANNIANVNTPAFKKDGQLFREYLTSYEKQSDVIEAPRDPATIESFYNMQGGDKSYADNIGTYTDYTQGSLKQTGNPLDLALEGKGFFEVLTPQGIRYTRNGTFHQDAEGRVVTK
ncbi:MAG TPA: flagellar hook basal-body protein, partial [Bdellovibrionales bacterium]|nr:flagellar hook basal-body protein [Bdellovibrionales bacterium]